MKERLQKRFKDLQKKDKKGFTLIELIVVLVILGIILAITVPAVTSYIGDAKDAKYLAEARSVFVVAEVERARAMISATDPEADWSVLDTSTPSLDDVTDKVGLGEVTVMTYTKGTKLYNFTFESSDGKTVVATAKSNDTITVVSVSD